MPDEMWATAAAVARRDGISLVGPPLPPRLDGGSANGGNSECGVQEAAAARGCRTDLFEFAYRSVSAISAALQKQLGLKVEPRKESIEMLMVEDAVR
jgi:hypothetical protein